MNHFWATVLQTVAQKWFISLIYVQKFPLEERFEFGGTAGDIADVITNVKYHVSRFRLLEVTTSRQSVIPSDQSCQRIAEITLICRLQ